MEHDDPQNPRKVGQGRSAEVFLDHDTAGRAIVRKIFVGEKVSKVVLYLLTGAANPYTWCEDAIRSAVLRRRILSHLVTYWFDDKLRLPRTDGWQWNGQHRAFELRTELIDGSHAPLRDPIDPRATRTGAPLRDLVHGVMKPLQRHLAEAGFDGLVWQAGRGNPVATNNFMLEAPADQLHWAWIDLESGVPALFAINPLATLGFYLPKSLHHRGWLFDDVDLQKLSSYLSKHQEAIEAAVGPSALADVRRHAEELESRQKAWKSIPRHQRSLAYELSRGYITADEAEYYRPRPLRWCGRMLPVTGARGARWASDRVKRACRWLWNFDPRGLTRAALRFTVSQRYRAHLAWRLMTTRIQSWHDRRFLKHGEVDLLHSQLRREDVSSYITDFGVHLLIKPPIKFCEWVIVPALLGFGVLDVVTAGILIVSGGTVGRTLYTSGRFVQAIVRRQRRPWVALIVGVLPVVGNAAYPAQLVYCSTEESGELARFILYDSLAAVGRAVPVWGGADSRTEHVFNRLGDVAVAWLQKPIA